MKVACATEHMMSCFQEVYSDVFALSRRKDETDIDLLIFTGGSDINPALYGQAPNGAMGWDVGRDKVEQDIFVKWSRGRLKAKYVLGVCRGHQLINVLLGGGLYQDIEHPGVHEVTWQVDTPLKEFPLVNSLHHQAVSYIGEGGIVLGVEPATRLPEAILFKRNLLTVQFHPEFFGKERRKTFFSMIDEWVAGKLNIVPPSSRSPKMPTFGDFTSYTFTSTDNTNNP